VFFLMAKKNRESRTNADSPSSSRFPHEDRKRKRRNGTQALRQCLNTAANSICIERPIFQPAHPYYACNQCYELPQLVKITESLEMKTRPSYSANPFVDGVDVGRVILEDVHLQLRLVHVKRDGNLL